MGDQKSGGIKGRTHFFDASGSLFSAQRGNSANMYSFVLIVMVLIVRMFFVVWRLWTLLCRQMCLDVSPNVDRGVSLLAASERSSFCLSLA